MTRTGTAGHAPTSDVTGRVPEPDRTPTAVAVGRCLTGLLVLVVLAVAYAAQPAAARGRPLDFLGYFTNLTNLLTAAVLIATGGLALVRRLVPSWLVVARAVAAACLLVVAVVYNVLVPGTGGAARWVSAVLHVVVPGVVVLDWWLVADRPRPAWRLLWWVLPYPLAWLAVTLVRGATDGWVPYGFLLPERGAGSLALHVAGLLAALVAAGALVWAAARAPGPRAQRSRGRSRTFGSSGAGSGGPS